MSTASSTDPLFQVTDLRVAFGKHGRFHEAVRGISLSVNHGEVLGIVGESGSGKSVGMLAALGLQSANARVTGSVRFQGRELVGLEDPLSVYIVHVIGSAKLRLPDESIMYVGYAGKTDHEYLGLGKAMVESGLVSSDELSLAAIKRAYKRNPEQVQELIYQNDHYVFFTEYEGDNWPSGS